MRIALISPYSTGPVRGNITTVSRISRLLQQAGAEVLVLSADVLSAEEMERRLASFAPQVLHGFHASYCGGLTRRLAERFNVPYVITITGSDVHSALLRDHPETVQTLAAARSVICFHDSEATELVSHFPQTAEKATVISQSVEAFPPTAAENFGMAEETFVLLLPAALRPVKQVEFPLLALKSITHRFPLVRLVIAGGSIDQDYAATIRNMLCDAPYAVWIGEIPHERMAALYRRSNVVLNCSLSESMSNTILEAMDLGRPVLARDIPGNRSLICHGDSGLLYQDQESFLHSVIRLVQDSALRTELGRRAVESVRSLCSPKREVAEHIRLYRSLIAEGSVQDALIEVMGRSRDNDQPQQL